MKENTHHENHSTDSYETYCVPVFLKEDTKEDHPNIKIKIDIGENPSKNPFDNANPIRLKSMCFKVY